jgi:hypothetical protein
MMWGRESFNLYKPLCSHAVYKELKNVKLPDNLMCYGLT